MIEKISPTIYKGESIYKTGGAGGVYNGRSVYNDNVVSYVEIGGINYGYKQINNRYWLISSLKNSTSNSYLTPNGLDAGLLYPYNDFSQINSLLHSGWRIPTKNDFIDLLGGSETISNTSLLSEIDGGTNTTGFGARLTGYINQNSSYLNNGVRGYMWTKTEYTSSYYMWNSYYSLSGFEVNDYARKANTKLQIRLCKDL